MEEQSEQPLFASRVALEDLRQKAQEIRQEIAKIIVGQQEMVDLLLTAILSNGHILIEGVPGVAKTMTAKILSRILSVQFSRIQFTPDLMPSDVLGTNVFNLKESRFEFKSGPIFSQTVLIDEINRAPAKTQAALFEVMEERQVTIDGKRYPMEEPFTVIATQNPIEQEGTYRLPEAQLDRFLFKIVVRYPALEEEVAILQGFHQRRNLHPLDEISPLLSAAEVALYRQKVRDITADPQMLRYIAQIVHQTRQHAALYLGASPRASLAILTSSKAYAALQGRDFITPDDVKRMVYPVLCHRVVLTPEKEMEGMGVEQVIRQIVEQVEVPR